MEYKQDTQCLVDHTYLFYLFIFIYQLFWTQTCPEEMCTNGTQVPCTVPSLPNPTNRNGWPHHGGLRPLLFSNSDVGSFRSQKNKPVKVQWDRTFGFSSLVEKTRKSNHLQMSVQRQHFLLSYLKTLSIGPAGVWTLQPPARQTDALPTELTRRQSYILHTVKTWLGFATGSPIIKYASKSHEWGSILG